MTGAYRFGKYILRPATDADLATAETWVCADPWHATTTEPEFFLSHEKGIESFVLEDPDGPVFFFRMTRTIRLDIQFPPDDEQPTDRPHERTREALIQGVEWLAGSLALAGIHQLIFDSVNPLLIRSAERRLGFHRSPNELVRDIAVRKEVSSVRSDSSTDQLTNRAS